MTRQQALQRAVERMTVMRYFPSEPAARSEIMRILDSMITTREQLEWLITAMIDQVGEWQGPRELRGVFCTRFRPRDGIEGSSSHSAFSPEANEGRAIAEHELQKQMCAEVRWPRTDGTTDLASAIAAVAQRKAIS